MHVARTIALALALATSISPAPSRAAASPPLDRADAAWDRRAEGQVAARARPEPIREAIEGYRAAIAAEPERLDARWKLLRALWFAGDFAAADAAAERGYYEEAVAAAEEALRVLATRVGGADALDDASPETLREKLAPADRSDAAHLYFWHAVSLGAWARMAGLLSAVRAGVAGRLHEATQRSIALDPAVEQGGAIRLLSRLHSELPHVPLFSGWVDPEQAVPLAERAVAEYPRHPGNPFLLGIALLLHDPARRDEAIELIERTAQLVPRSDHVVEDLTIQIAAREELALVHREAVLEAGP